MEAYTRPLDALAEDLSWFIRAPELRLFHVVVSAALRPAALSLLEAAELHADNLSPLFPTDAPFSPAQPGWGARRDAIHARHRDRRGALAEAGIPLDPLPPAPAAPGGRGAFAAALGQAMALSPAPLTGALVLLAPTSVEGPQAWAAEVGALVGARGLEGARWIVVDVDTSTLGDLPASLGEAALAGVYQEDAQAARQELSAQVERAAEAPAHAPGPALVGAAWPAGCLPPPRVDDPPPAASLPPDAIDAAGLDEALAEVAPELRSLVLRAALAMGWGRGEEAVSLQRQALRRCTDGGLLGEASLMGLNLGAYLFFQSERQEAEEVLADAARRGDAAGLPAQAAVAHLTLGSAVLMGGRPKEAAAHHQAAADRAVAAGIPSLALEALDLAGGDHQLAGDAAAARACWSRALDLAEALPPGDPSAASAPRIRARLEALSERAEGGA